MTSEILFRTDADNSTGYGHLMRCLYLAEELRRRRKAVVFALARLDPSARRLIERHGHRLLIVSGNNANLDMQELRANGLRSLQAAVLDFSHRHTLAQVDRVPAYVRAVRDLAGFVLMFDGFRDDSVASKVSNLDVDLLVTPYVGAEEERGVPAGVRARLMGPRFFVFSPAYRALAGRQRRVRRHADRLLLTFGGTDPFGITLKGIAATRLIRDRRLHIRMIIGAGFDSGLASEIRKAATARAHQFEVVDAPESLASHLKWCDLAITGSGLTKYELALIGTPSIQLSIDDVHARVNEEFARAGTAIDLGVHSNVTAAKLAVEIRRVLDSVERRKEMSRQGRKLTDGRGAERIVSTLIELESSSRGIARNSVN